MIRLIIIIIFITLLVSRLQAQNTDLANMLGLTERGVKEYMQTYYPQYSLEKRRDDNTGVELSYGYDVKKIYSKMKMGLVVNFNFPPKSKCNLITESFDNRITPYDFAAENLYNNPKVHICNISQNAREEIIKESGIGFYFDDKYYAGMCSCNIGLLSSLRENTLFELILNNNRELALDWAAKGASNRK